MKKENAEIDCPIFQKQEPVIKYITDKINQAKGVLEKARFAEELKKKKMCFFLVRIIMTKSLIAKIAASL